MEPSFGADRLLVEGEAARFLDDAIGVLVAKLRAQIPWSAVKDEISGGGWGSDSWSHRCSICRQLAARLTRLREGQEREHVTSPRFKWGIGPAPTVRFADDIAACPLEILP